MFANSPLIGGVEAAWQAIVPASLMLTGVGLLIALLFSRVAVKSWRLRCWLLSAVLLQGMMLCRAPLHLGWIESDAGSTATSAMVTGLSEAGWLAARRGVTETRTPDMASLAVDPSAEQERSLRNIWAGVAWARILGLIWLSTAAGWIMIAALKYTRLLKLLRGLDPAPPQWQQAWRDIALPNQTLPGRSHCEMLISQSVGPLVVRRPRGYVLIVPEAFWRGLSRSQRTGVMLHERAHLQRHDVWRQLAARSIAIAHWFNPVAWWALREYERTAELACDHRVAQHGRAAAAGFASALVELVQWHQRCGTDHEVAHGLGVQAMATPPLSNRIAHLLQSPSQGDSLMKRCLLVCFALALLAASFFQIRLTTAEDSPVDRDATESLRVVSAAMDERLTQLATKLETDDATTKRFGDLIQSPEGKIALAGLLNQLSGSARDSARADALPRFVSVHFTRSDDGSLQIRPEHSESVERWVSQSQRLAENLAKVQLSTDQLAMQMDTSSQAGALFQRLLKDPQAPAAILLFEMKHGGDVIDRFVSEALGKILVDRGDGSFQLVPSRRADAEKLVQRFEMARKISEKLRPQLAIWADEFDDSDENHRELIGYMKNPRMASVMALQISDDREYSSPSAAVDDLFQRLETVSEDTLTGLRINNPDVWNQFAEIFRAVDRADDLATRVGERLSVLATTLTTDDDLSARLAQQLRMPPAAILIAAELPYAEADPGDQLRLMLDKVMTQSGDRDLLTIRPDHEQAVAEKAKELLHVCREIRRHAVSVDELLASMEDQPLVNRMGDAGRYWMLAEVRDFAERQRIDPIDLMEKELFVRTDGGTLQVREDRRETVRRLVAQAEQVANEAGKDDF